MRSVIVGLCLGACVALRTLQAGEDLPCCDPPKAEDRDRRPATDLKDPPPCGCPYARISDQGGGIWLFHAEYFAESCDDPYVTVMYGPENLPLSPGCDENCIGDKFRTKHPLSPPKYYPGLPDYVSHDTLDALPHPDDQAKSQLLTDPKLPYIRFQTSSTDPTTRYAKVFVHALDIGKQKRFRHLFYLAKEVATAPPEGAVAPFVICRPMQDQTVTQGKECHIFCAGSQEQPIAQVTLLTIRSAK